MENYSYNSYPDSGNSSPRSREIDFENPSPWEDQAQNYKAKFMCSYGGKIQPRPHDNQLSYVGGETKILSVDRNIKFSSMVSKLSALCGGESEVSFKYQLPGEDLDALISVTNDDDLEHMMMEYDRMFRASAKPARMRLFIFPVTGANSSFSSDGGKSERERFVEALNSGPGAEKNSAVSPNNVDFLFGLEKGMVPPPPVKVAVPEVVAQPPPPPPPIPEVVGSDHVLNRVEVQSLQRQLHELQRLQIRDQEQLAMYRKKDADENNPVTYTGDYYAQKLPEKAPPGNIPVTGQQQVPPPPGYWPEKQVPAAGYPATVTTGLAPTHPSEHQVYMIPGPPPGTVYHAQSPIPAQAPAPTQAQTSAPPPQMVRPVMTSQPGQGYYTNVQRMPPELYREHTVYNMAAAAPTHHQPQISQVQPQMMRPSGGVTEQGYTQIPAYDRQVYYTAPGGMMLPPQYQGVGVAVSGELRTAATAEGKGVTKVSQGSG